jgi:uncharacterized protein YbaP (TraB family)
MPLFSRLLALLATVTAASLPAKTLPTARPALWKLADADTTIWLFGTLHVLPDKYIWRSPAIETAIGQSNSLTLETVLDDDPAALARVLISLGQASGLPPLADRVPPARRKALATLIKASGVPEARLQGMKTWAAAVLLTGAAMQQIGVPIGGDAGVEAQLTHSFRAAGKPVDGLETPAQQLGFFDALPESAQRAFLSAMLDSPAKASKEFNDMIRSWARGDIAGIARAFDDDPEFTPETRELLIRRRDLAWADTLARRLETPGIVFVAVGAGHLTGRDAVQPMLAAKGLKVVRVQ